MKRARLREKGTRRYFEFVCAERAKRFRRIPSHWERSLPSPYSPPRGPSEMKEVKFQSSALVFREAFARARAFLPHPSASHPPNSLLSSIQSFFSTRGWCLGPTSPQSSPNPTSLLIGSELKRLLLQSLLAARCRTAARAGSTRARSGRTGTRRETAWDRAIRSVRAWTRVGDRKGGKLEPERGHSSLFQLWVPPSSGEDDPEA